MSKILAIKMVQSKKESTFYWLKTLHSNVPNVSILENSLKQYYQWNYWNPEKHELETD